MKKLLFFVWVILISTSCEKNYIENSTIAGVWVEASHKTDTLVFDNQTTELSLNLKRGTEIRNGYLLPKYYSGSYWYEIENDSISLRWWASSSSYATKYYFKLDLKNRSIKIGNFFDSSINSNVIFTFTKVQ